MQTENEVIEERKRRLEELRRKRNISSGQLEFTATKIDEIIKAIIESTQARKKSDTQQHFQQEEVEPVLLEQLDTYETVLQSEKQDAPQPGTTQVDRYHKGVETTPLEQKIEKKSALDKTTIQSEQDTAASGTMYESDAESVGDNEAEHSESIKAIKKRVRVMERDECADLLGRHDVSTFLANSALILERAICQLEDYDYLIDYRAKESVETMKDIIKFYKSYSSDNVANRCVMDVKWSPVNKNYLLAAYHIPRNDNPSSLFESTEGMLVLWDSKVNDHCYRTFYCASAVFKATFHPFMKDLIIGALYNGQVVAWDLSKGDQPTLLNNITDSTHSQPINGLCVYGDHEHSKAVTCSADGMLCLWSLECVYDPIATIKLPAIVGEGQSSDNEMIITCMSNFNSTQCTLCVGCEDGKVYALGFRDGLYTLKRKLMFHSAPVFSIHINSMSVRQHSTKWSSRMKRLVEDVYISDLTLTCGMDWKIALWVPNLLSVPLATFESVLDNAYDVQWNPANPSVFAAAVGGGILQVWNILKDLENPICEKQVSEFGINTLQWSDNGKRICVGDSVGKLFIYEADVEINECVEADLEKLIDMIRELETEIKSRRS